MTEGEGWKGEGGSVERVMMLEQRAEQQERETSTLKVSCEALSQSHKCIPNIWCAAMAPCLGFITLKYHLRRRRQVCNVPCMLC